MDISVVIPTFRRNQQLAEALASVQAQQGVGLEVLVVDDSPEAGAAPVVAGLSDPRIAYLHNPNPTGGVPSVVRNLGWPRTSGRLIHFLDDDDIVPAGHYASVIAEFVRHPQVGLMFGQIEPFGSAPQTQIEHERHYFARAAARAALCARLGSRLGFAGQMLFAAPLFVCSAAVVRRECVAGVGGFDPEIRLMEDADFHARVIRRYGARFLRRTTLRYRIGYPSLMHAPDPPPEQLAGQREGRRRMQAKYRREHGTADFFATAALGRIIRSLPGTGG
jgi:GT2 family glycosyltransferase